MNSEIKRVASSYLILYIFCSVLIFVVHQGQHQEWRLCCPLNTRNSLAIVVFLNVSASKVFFSNEGKHRVTETGWLQVLHLICLSQGKEINYI